MSLGAFTFVLHSHMPFYRGAGRWPHGEENLHEVMAESYLPILEGLTDLHEAGVNAKVTLGITPILAEQLADPLVIGHFEEYLQQEIDGAAAEVQRFEKGGNQHLLYLSHYYLNLYRHTLQAFQQRFNRDIVGGLRRLQDAGVVEILTSAATHPYLPLVERDSTIFAQLALGKRATARHFGREPRAIWLPECAYRPGYYATAADGSRYERPGLEYWLQERGIDLFFSESGAVEGSRLVGRAYRDTREVMRHISPTGEPLASESMAAGLYDQAIRALEEAGYESAGFVTEKRIVPFEGQRTANADSGTFEAYLVRDSDVSVVGRNHIVGAQVWSADFGYPGDAFYREFHKKDPEHGFQYWRVTEGKPDLAYKKLYEPFKAGQRVQDHARHFSWLVQEQLNSFSQAHDGEKGFIVAAYDTELFGHWWYEGAAWLKEVLTTLAADDSVELLTASEWLDRIPTEKVIDLPESSWGHHGTHITWYNPDTAWMWDAVHAAERRMETLVERYPDAQGGLRDALNQAARELVLLEASDWEFLHTTGQARQYATGRFTEHATRFSDLASALESESAEEMAPEIARRYGERDNPFPDMDYRLFARRQPE